MYKLCIITNKNNKLVSEYCKLIQKYINCVVLFDARKYKSDPKIWGNIEVKEMTWKYLKSFGITKKKCMQMSPLTSQGSSWFGICYAHSCDEDFCFIIEDDVTCNVKILKKILDSYQYDKTDLICSKKPQKEFHSLRFVWNYHRIWNDLKNSEIYKYSQIYSTFTFAYRISKRFASFLIDKYSIKHKNGSVCHHEIMMITDCINNNYSYSHINLGHVGERWTDGADLLGKIHKINLKRLNHPDKFWSNDFYKKQSNIKKVKELIIFTIKIMIIIFMIHIVNKLHIKRRI